MKLKLSGKVFLLNLILENMKLISSSFIIILFHLVSFEHFILICVIANLKDNTFINV